MTGSRPTVAVLAPRVEFAFNVSAKVLQQNGLSIGAARHGSSSKSISPVAKLWQRSLDHAMRSMTTEISPSTGVAAPLVDRT